MDIARITAEAIEKADAEAEIRGKPKAVKRAESEAAAKIRSIAESKR